MELIEDDPGEITQSIDQVLHRTDDHTTRRNRKEGILNALTILDGHKLATATALRIGKTTLYRKPAEYALPKHRLHQEMQHAAKTEGKPDEAKSQDQPPQTSNLNS